MGPLIPLFWTSGDICPGFQSQGEVACTLSCLHASDGSKGGRRGCAPPPGGQNFFIFMQFLVKIDKIIGWCPSLGVGAPSSGKSWICHCMLSSDSTSGATPAGLLAACMVTHHVLYMLSFRFAEIGCWGSNRGSPDQYTDTLPTWPP